MFKLVMHDQIGHKWSHLSHMVTLVKLVTHCHIGHTLSHWSLGVTVFETLCSNLTIDGEGGGEEEGERRLIDLLASPQVKSSHFVR